MRKIAIVPLPAVLVLACGCALSGCVVGEIRDELNHANTQLDTKRIMLDDTNARLDRVSTQLDDLQRTTENLEALNKQLEVLTSIDASLKQLDRHLASLRGTIESIDSTIPFLRFSHPDVVDEAESQELIGESEEMIDAPAADEAKPAEESDADRDQKKDGEK